MSNIGVDMGGTRIKAALVRGSEILRSEVVDTGAFSSPGEVMDAVASAVGALQVRAEAVGFAIPGEVDSQGYCWALPNVPGFRGVNMARELSLRVGCPVVVENDATVAALGEWLYGWGKHYANFLMVTLGTGIGGGLVLGGRLHRGSNGFAGEIGHLQLDRSPSAPKDAAGLPGTLEAYASTAALLSVFHAGGGQGTEVLHIAASARRGEAAGLAAFEHMGRALGEGLNSIQNVLDLDAVVFSGGVSLSLDLIEPHMRAAMTERAYAKPLVEVPLLQSQLGDSAGLVGAAHLVEYTLGAQPTRTGD